MVEQQADVIKDVGNNVAELSNAITEVRTLKLKSTQMDSEEVRNRLRRSLEICRNTHEAVDSITQDDRYAEYE